MKKWTHTKDVESLFITTHKGNVGGGELYAHQIAEAFDELTDMRYYGPPPTSQFRKFHDFDHRFIHTSLIGKCDIFVSASHFVIPEPAGKDRNILVCYFPNKDHVQLVKPFDTVITTSHFCAEWVKKYWKKKAHVVYPYLGKFWRLPLGHKKTPNMIVNVGRFFREADGHGKRQDVLIEAFAMLVKEVPGATLHLAGAVTSAPDRYYADSLHKLSKDLGVEEKVHIHIQPDLNVLKKLYCDAEYYWHSNGFGQTDPFKTEHFGIVIAEAMACGCEPFIYENGGYEEFECQSWKTEEELAEFTFDSMKAGNVIGNGADLWCEIAQKFSRENLIEGVRNTIQK